MTEIVTLIQTVGFPIAVALYFMIKGTQDTKSLINAVNGLTTMIQRLLDKENLK